MNNKQIKLKDDKGKEIIFNILFTFENDGNKYVICYEDKNKDILIPFKYDDKGNAYIVDNKKELDIIQECIDSYDGLDVNDEENN